MEHAVHLIKLICILRPDFFFLFHVFLSWEEMMTQAYLLVRVWGGVLRRARRAWCRPAGRRTSTTVRCVTTTHQATTTASGHVRGVRPSSRGASKVRHKNIQYLCMYSGNGWTQSQEHHTEIPINFSCTVLYCTWWTLYLRNISMLTLSL